jgi:hypothetical protein
VLRRFTVLALVGILLAGAGVCPRAALAQDQKSENQKEGKTLTPEQIAETVIYAYSGGGGRQRLSTIQRNGIERGRVTRAGEEGRTEEITYERRFIRGESAEKDKIRLDQKMSSMEYSLVYNGGRIFGIINGTTFTPRQEALTSFLMPAQRSIDALLRYKENGATLAYVGKEKQKNIDMWILDLTDKEKRRTRYYISAQRARVLWLEYEEAGALGGQPIKFKRTFHDYTYAQGTLVPYRTILYQDGKQSEQSNITTVSFGLKMDESVFQNGETTANAETP